MGEERENPTGDFWVRKDRKKRKRKQEREMSGGKGQVGLQEKKSKTLLEFK